MKGWICLHRKLLDSDFWNDGEQHNRKSAWIDLLLLANHADKEIIFDGEPLIVKRGQYLTSVRQLMRRWQWSKDRTQRFLRTLELRHMIVKDSDTRRTLITVVNYDFYQNTCDTTKDTTKDSSKDSSKDTTKDSSKDSSKDTTKDTTKDSSEPQTTIYNNINNDNNKKGGAFSPPTIEEVKAYCQERGNKVDPESFVDFYTAKGWKVGSNTMKDWKACVRTWERRDRPQTKNKFNNFTGRQYDTKELEKALLRKGEM